MVSVGRVVNETASSSSLSLEHRAENLSLYRVLRPLPLRHTAEFIASTPESRAVCNNPFLLGVKYTDAMRGAATSVINQLGTRGLFAADEESTVVMHILRGGLNFQLREALAGALGWNLHRSWFISAQRQPCDAAGKTWEIVEDSYSKMGGTGIEHIVLGDVVATGTSLMHGLAKIERQVLDANGKFASLLFFTIGGENATLLIERFCRQLDEICGAAPRATVVYLEGIFEVASEATPLRTKIPGTDLLRRSCLMAPEFLESQYTDPCFPLERCTIYDAGSRAFEVPHYLEDVRNYWQEVAQLGGSGVGFRELLQERCPLLDPDRLGAQDLVMLAQRQIERCGSAQS